MSTSVLGAGSITFGDGSSQSTAAIFSHGAQFFTSSGTFTIPTGVTALKVTLQAGGAQSPAMGYTGPCNCTLYFFGNDGGTSSVSSGSQGISTISVSGGISGNGYGGKTFSNVALYWYGGDGRQYSDTPNNTYGNQIAYGGRSYFASPSYENGNGTGPKPPTSWGSGGTRILYNPGPYGSNGGGAGASAIGYLSGLTPGLTLSVTVGGGGPQNGGYAQGWPGIQGFVLIEW